MQKRVECMVRGDVQGVSYRQFVNELAERLHIVGSVRNLPEGDVEVIAEGEEASLRELLKALLEQHTPARVTQINEKWNKTTGRFTHFSILKS